MALLNGPFEWGVAGAGFLVIMVAIGLDRGPRTEAREPVAVTMSSPADKAEANDRFLRAALAKDLQRRFRGGGLDIDCELTGDKGDTLHVITGRGLTIPIYNELEKDKKLRRNMESLGFKEITVSNRRFPGGAAKIELHPSKAASHSGS